jgi:hypothetical protein
MIFYLDGVFSKVTSIKNTFDISYLGGNVHVLIIVKENKIGS